ncbi:hypothetical protein QN355_06295 [Cryobacterium sp. 10S3]|uniref:hypothetical protein n=1 Tax=Cryobacterium sp. 10S3 TaxID=3048582 RepID=UPI002AC8CE65|nr:hypothetical protein [Cryobacterium sp. 10S3]MEB0286158.1 hypothetical protein [Cryobacterium sp. 10S3]WPX12216.1 hypothetical protein RHM57_11035 [Cryobacterium sp. 10S3]
MAKLRINGHDLVVKTMSKARNIDIIELQRQSGIKMGELRELVTEADHMGNVIASFLAQHNAGFKVGWDDLLNGTLEDLGEIIAEPGDEPAKVEDEAEENPPVRSETVAADDAAAPAPTPA